MSEEPASVRRGREGFCSFMILTVLHLAIILLAFWECLQCAPQLRSQIFRFIMFGAIGMIHGVAPLMVAPWHQRMAEPYAAHVEAAAYVLAGTLLLGIGFRLYHRWIRVPTVPMYERIKLPPLQSRLDRLIYLSAIIGVMAWIGNLYASGGSLLSVMSAGRFDFRGEGNNILSGLFIHFYFLLSVPGFLGAQSRGFPRLFGVGFGLFVALLLLVVSKGTRAGSIGILGGVLIGAVLATRISVPKLVGVGTVLGLTMFLTVGLVPLRYQISQMRLSEMVLFLLSRDAYQDAFAHDPLNYHDYLISIVDLYPATYDFVDMGTYRRILFFFLPASQFPMLKPADTDRLVAEALYGNRALEVDWMHPPGAFGDVYLNFWGWRGIVMFVPVGLFYAWFTRRALTHPIAYLSIGPQLMQTALLMVRGQPYAVATFTLSSLIITYGLLRVTGISLAAPVSRVHRNKTSLLPRPVRRAA